MSANLIYYFHLQISHRLIIKISRVPRFEDKKVNCYRAEITGYDKQGRIRNFEIIHRRMSTRRFIAEYRVI